MKRNVAIIIIQLVGIFLCCHAAARARHALSLAGLALAFGILMNSVYAIIHEAEHAMLFPDRRWNDLAGAAMALFFPAPFHLIRQGHLGHHFRNRSDDEAFDLYFEGDHRLWRYLVLYGILTGCYWIVVVLGNVVFLFFPFAADKKYWDFDRPSRAFMESLSPSYRRLIRLECLAVICLHAAIIWVFHIPPANYAIMYFGFGLTWSAMQYVHHYGTERHVTRGARNLWLWEPIDRLWLNHNWHLAHHEHPTVPWVHLPALGSTTQIEKRGFLPWSYFKMWRGPRKATERVENQYAGRGIRLWPRLIVLWPAKLWLTVIFNVFFWSFYFFLSWHALVPVHSLPITFLDDWAGFRPTPWAWIYESNFILTGFIPWLIVSRTDLRRFVMGFALLSAVSFLIFALYPVAAPRPVNLGENKFLLFITRVDGPLNAFPSLHAASLVYTIALVRRLFGRQLKPAVLGGLLVWVALILFATLATKQHYALDLVAGGLIGWFAAWFAWRKTDSGAMASATT